MKGLQNEIMIILEIIPKLMSIGFVLVIVISFYGIVGVAAFYNTSEGSQHFSNFVEGEYTYFAGDSMIH